MATGITTDIRAGALGRDAGTLLGGFAGPGGARVGGAIGGLVGLGGNRLFGGDVDSYASHVMDDSHKTDAFTTNQGQQIQSGNFSMTAFSSSDSAQAAALALRKSGHDTHVIIGNAKGFGTYYGLVDETAVQQANNKNVNDKVPTEALKRTRSMVTDAQLEKAGALTKQFQNAATDDDILKIINDNKIFDKPLTHNVDDMAMAMNLLRTQTGGGIRDFRERHGGAALSLRGSDLAAATNSIKEKKGQIDEVLNKAVGKDDSAKVFDIAVEYARGGMKHQALVAKLEDAYAGEGEEGIKKAQAAATAIEAKGGQLRLASTSYLQESSQLRKTFIEQARNDPANAGKSEDQIQQLGKTMYESATGSEAQNKGGGTSGVVKTAEGTIAGSQQEVLQSVILLTDQIKKINDNMRAKGML
jgi:hypothetical protein